MVEQLRHAQHMLVERERLASLGRLVTNLAQEINSPLGVCLTVATALERQRGELRAKLAAGPLKRSDFEQFIDDLSEGGRLLHQNLMRTADLFANLRRLTIDPDSAQRRRFDLREMLAATIGMLEPVLKPGRHRVELHCPEGIACDSYPGALDQVVSQIVSNAVRHGFAGREDGHIEIRVERIDEANVELRLWDDGHGIEREAQRHVFDPFFTGRPDTGGTGLGLHIAHHVVTSLLGGSIQVRSTPGQGTLFLIRIQTRPVAQAEGVLHGTS